MNDQISTPQIDLWQICLSNNTHQTSIYRINWSPKACLVVEGGCVYAGLVCSFVETSMPMPDVDLWHRCFNNVKQYFEMWWT